jgi:histidinol dehydrogenase
MTEPTPPLIAATRDTGPSAPPVRTDRFRKDIAWVAAPLAAGVIAGFLWWLLAPGGGNVLSGNPGLGNPSNPDSWLPRDLTLAALMVLAGCIIGLTLDGRLDGPGAGRRFGFALAGGAAGALAAWGVGLLAGLLWGPAPEPAGIRLHAAILCCAPAVAGRHSLRDVRLGAVRGSFPEARKIAQVSSPSESNATVTASLDFRSIDFRGRRLSLAELKSALPRAKHQTMADAEQKVLDIIADVRSRGFGALADLAAKFDGVEQSHPRVPVEEIANALRQLDPGVRAALEESITRAKQFAERQKPANVDVQLADGAVVSQNWIPVGRVGLYVPGGLAPLASSVIMNVVPAVAAGVESIALASPPQKDFGGLPHPTILAAAALLGIDEVYAIGGAQAIVSFAYGVPGDGTELPIEPVDVVTGPGNIFVATAKRLVKGVVGIDSEAGTTEIAILADATAKPALVAADLISQAEHDPKAASVLVTESAELAGAVVDELNRQAAATKHSARVREALSGPQSGVVLVDDLEQGIAVCNAYAAEHLEIMTANAPAVAGRIRNAGAIFVGDYSPVSLGDYCAGSNHVLPTSGTAAFSSGLNVTTFLRAVQVINYDRAALEQVSGHIVNLAGAEDLPGHGEAVQIRFAERS